MQFIDQRESWKRRPNQLGASYSQNDGFSGQIGAAGAGMRGGINYTESSGIGVYAGKSLGKGPLGGITSTEIGWDRNKGFQASYGSDNARATFSQKDGFGAKLSGDYAGFGGELAITQKGGFSASLAKQYAGVNGKLSYNSQSGFSANVSGSIAGNDLNLGIAEGGKLSFNQSNPNQDESLFINSMDELQSMNDKDIKAAKDRIVAESFDKYKKTMIALNPELAEYENDPEKLQAKIKELDKDNKLKHPDNRETVQTGASRDSIFSKIGGAISDLGSSFLGTSVASGMGYVDEKGQFRQRTCFVAGTKIHTQTGLKNIEDVQIGDVVLSWNEVTGKREYKTVTNLWVRKTNLLYAVKLPRKEPIVTTWNHPFWSVTQSAWIETKDLKEGEILSLGDGSEISIESITHYDTEETTVYNFEVEGNHTYYVSEAGVLVHNDGNAYAIPDQLMRDAARLWAQNNKPGAIAVGATAFLYAGCISIDCDKQLKQDIDDAKDKFHVEATEDENGNPIVKVKLGTPASSIGIGVKYERGKGLDGIKMIAGHNIGDFSSEATINNQGKLEKGTFGFKDTKFEFDSNGKVAIVNNMNQFNAKISYDTKTGDSNLILGATKKINDGDTTIGKKINIPINPQQIKLYLEPNRENSTNSLNYRRQYGCGIFMSCLDR